MQAINNDGNLVEVADGMNLKMIDGQAYILTPEDEAQRKMDEAAENANANNVKIIAQIRILEAQQTPRRMREAIFNNSWLLDVNNQIAALRAQLI